MHADNAWRMTQPKGEMTAPATGDAELDELLAQQQRFLRGEETPAAVARRVTSSRAAGGVASGTASAATGSLRPSLQELAPGSGASPEVITQALRDAALEPRPGGRGAGTGNTGAAATAQAARPAASVTRVPGGRSNPAPAGVSHVEGIASGARPGEPSAAAPSGVPPTPPVLGDILERTSSEVPKPPSAPQPHGRGFPAALHRSQRPFGAASLAAPAPQAVAPAAPARMETSIPASMDGSSIEAEVHARLAAMTPSDVDHALEELRERLAPDKLAFLQRRGQQRGQGASRQEGAAVREPASRAAAAATSSRLPSAPVALDTDKPVQQQPQPAAQPNGAAAVRFTLAGHLLQPEEQGASVLPPAGVSRDPLRMEGDPGAGGYTLADVVMLCRSAVPAQRVAGLRALACCVRAIRTGMAQHELGSAAEPPPAPGVSWAAVYVHAVKAQRLALLLRTALDDSATSAIAAAASAAAALVADVHEELLWEAVDGLVVGISSNGDDNAPLDADDVASCRRHPSQPHCRTRAGAPWDPVVPWPGTAADSGEGDGQGEVAVETDASDPCQALLRMSVVARVRFLLEAAQHGGAAHALLQLLLALARHSPSAAQALAATPRMMLTLRTCFIEATPPGGVAAETLDDDIKSAAGTAPQPRQPPEFWHCRPLAVQLLRTLVEVGGAPAAVAAAQEGLIDACVARFVPVALVPGAVASPGDITDAGEAATQGAVLRREALRLWRCTVRTDPNLAPLVESYFGALVPALQPPKAHGSARAGPWDVCRDVFRLLAATQGAGAPQGHSLSQPAAAAVAAAALRWATPEAVRSITACDDNGTSSVALAALAAVLHYLRKCATDQEALPAAMALAQSGIADSGPLRHLLAAVAHHDVLHSGTAACGAALASVSLCHALLALLRRGVPLPSASAAPGDVSRTAAARHVAQVMSAALDGILAPLAFRDDASKEAWGPAAQRAMVLVLCSAQAAALCALTAPGSSSVASSLPASLDVAESRRVVHAAAHVVGAAPPGGDAIVRRVIDGVVTAPSVMTSLCAAGLEAATAAGSVVGSAAQEELLASGSAGAETLPMPLRPPVRGACRARLHAAAGLKPDGADSAVSGSRLPAPGWWLLRALGLASSASDWAIDAATGASVSLAVDSAQQEVSAALLTLLMALERPQRSADGTPPGPALVPAAVKLRLLGGVFGASTDGVLRHPAARLTCAALTDVYTCSLRRDAASTSAGDDTDSLVAESSATDLVHRFADASFGDPLHGRHVALALRLRSPARARVAALHALLDKQVAHLLPPLSAFQFPGRDGETVPVPPAEVLFLAPGGEQSPQMLRMWVDFLTSGRDFERAAAAGALPAAVAAHAVRCALRELAAPGDALVVHGSTGDEPPRRAALQALARTLAAAGPEPLRNEAATALLASQ